MKKGNIFVISAPSGAGKSSLVNALCKQDEQVSLSISHTTRAMRNGEANGINYYFTDNTHFEQMIAKNELLEYAKVYSNYYGTSVVKIQECLNSGKDILLEIDWQGAEQVKKIFPDANLIFILPPSIKILSDRLHNRNTDSLEVINTRLSMALDEIKHATQFDYIIINDNFNHALIELQCIIQTQRSLTKNMLDQLTQRFFKEI